MPAAESERFEGDSLVFMVADGMGGHAKGELASRTVLGVFKERRNDPVTAEGIRDSLRLAKERLNNLAENDRRSFGLGTTISGILFSGSEAFLLNCGDSRVYKADEEFRKVTKDHSVVQELVDSGMITEEQMRTHPQKNIVTSALMGDLTAGLPRYSLRQMAVNTGRRFLICSDGLWESLRDSEMAECLAGKGIREGVECLYSGALEAGAADNVSIILLEVAGV